jgi:hypothetical protein
MNMRWNIICGLGVSILTFLGAVKIASAQTATVPVSATTSAKHAALENLRQAHKLLVNADHDYDGHRARAAEEVHKAIRELEGKHRAKKVVSGTGTVVVKPAKPKQPASHEPQAASDAQLQQGPATAASLDLGDQLQASQGGKQRRRGDPRTQHGAEDQVDGTFPFGA